MPGAWLWLSLGAAFAVATADALTRRFGQDLDPWVLTWVRFGYGVPVFLAYRLLIDVPPLDATFWLALACLLPLEVAAQLCYVRALQISPLSLTVPILGFGPVFLLIVPAIILGERIGPQGILGVVLVAGGGYLLNLDRRRFGIWEPLLAIVRDPGPRLMLVTAALYAVTATVGKLALLHSSAEWFAGFYYTAIAIAFFPVAAVRARRSPQAFFRRPGPFLAIGALMAVMMVCHNLAIARAPVAYMISVKRLSLVFAVLYGGLWFRELNLRDRLLGVTVMCAGVVAIAFS